MSLIKCPKCGKEVSDIAKYCPECGCPVGAGTDYNGFGSLAGGFPQGGYAVTAKKSKKPLLVAIGAAVIIILIVLFFVVSGMKNKKEYCEGLKWGTSLKAVEKKYPGLTYFEGYDCYFKTASSVEGFAPRDGLLDLNFYFDDGEALYEIEVDYINEFTDPAVTYFVNHFNKIYDTDYVPYQDTKYEWYGNKTNVFMQSSGSMLLIRYEKAD